MGFEEVFVDHLRTVGAGVEHPDVEYALQEVVAGQEEQDHAQDLVEGCEKPEHDPVSQPAL